MLDTLLELFPAEMALELDTKRMIKLRAQGLRYLEKHFGSDQAMWLALTALEMAQGRVFEDLPHFVYACLLRADPESNEGRSPLSLEQLYKLIDDGADIGTWLEPTSQVVHNFFLHRTLGNAAKANLGALGPGVGPTT